MSSWLLISQHSLGSLMFSLLDKNQEGFFLRKTSRPLLLLPPIQPEAGMQESV